MSWKDNITFRGAKSLWTESSGPVEPDKLPLGYSEPMTRTLAAYKRRAAERMRVSRLTLVPCREGLG